MENVTDIKKKLLISFEKMPQIHRLKKL